MLLENYRDLEQYLLDATLRYMLFEEPAWPRLVAIIYEAARRVQNLLSTARLYLDQVKHDLSSMYGSENANASAFVQATNKEYNERLGYRTMEALRNYMQHRSLPLGEVSLGGERRKLPSGEMGVTTIRLKLDVAALDDDPKFKAAVRDELKAIKGEVEIKKLVRDYIEGLATIHMQVRSILARDIPGWESILQEAVKRFEQAFPENPQHVSIVARHEDGRAESEDIFQDFLERRRLLESKNSKGRHIGGHVVSSE